MNKRFVSIFLVVLVVAAAGGVWAGRWYLQWQADRAHEQKLAGLTTGESTGLRPGEPFPRVPLTTATGRTAHSDELGRAGQPLLVVFLSPGCDACAQTLSDWSRELETGGVSVPIVGVLDAPIDEVLEYARTTGLTFEVYADAEDRFGHEHGVDVIPTLAGVGEDGSIRFVRHGLPPGFTLRQAVEALAGS